MLAQKKKIKLFATYELGLPEIIMSDEKRVRQIIVNLIGNAFKFTLEG